MEYVQIQATLKAKHRKFTQEDEKLRRKTDAAGAEGTHGRASTTTGHGEPHGQPVVALAGPVFDASRTLRFVLFLVRVLCLYWVILGLFLLSSLIHMASNTSSNHMCLNL